LRLGPCSGATELLPAARTVNEDGEITGEFQASPNYLPPPVALGFPHPTDELDARIQLAATGYGDDTAARAALIEAELLTPAGPGWQTASELLLDFEGRPVSANYQHT
jgi:hypothetical protein